MISEKFLMGRGRHELSSEEKQVLEDGIESVRQVPARKQIVRAGDLTCPAISSTCTRFR
jgi:hypothetical protein